MHRTKVENRNSLETQLSYMWNHDYQDSAAFGKEMSMEDKQWEKRVSPSTVLRDEHHEVLLPFKDENVVFPDNCEQALKGALNSNNKCLSKDSLCA